MNIYHHLEDDDQMKLVFAGKIDSKIITQSDNSAQSRGDNWDQQKICPVVDPLNYV